MSQYQLFDALPDDEYRALRDDIAKRGVLVPIEIDGDSGEVLDGHHRLRICQELGITDYPRAVRSFDSDDEREEHVVTLNVRRRHLNGEQKRRWIEWFLRRHPERSDSWVAGDVGVDDMTVASVRSDLEATSEIRKLERRIGRDGKSRPAMQPKTKPTVIASSDDEQRRAQAALTEVAPERPVDIATAERAVKAQRREQQRQRHAELPAPQEPDQAVYRCIVIDPPWPMQKIDRDVRPNQTGFDYPTMTEDDLCGPFVNGSTIEDLADDRGSHLYLWTTHKFLPTALRLTETWGFRYQCLMTWVKNVGFTPFSWMYDTEHVIFARRGDLDVERKGLRLSFSAPTVGHSIKPDVFFDRVREASPGPRLELFARTPHEGFEPWGNEVPSAV